MGRCQYCDRAISNAYNLLRHQQDFHLDELPEGCEQCDRRFVNKEQKTRHMRQAHKLSCEVPGCLMKFPTEDKLNIHRAREHGGAGLVGAAGAGGARRPQQQQQVQKAGGNVTQPPQEMTAAQLLMQLPSYSNRAIPTFSAEMKRRSSAASNGFSGQRLRQEIEATADNNNDDDVYDNDEDDNGVEDEEDDPAASTAMVPSAKRARGTGATGRGRGARRTNGGKNMSNFYNNNNNNNNNNNGHVVPSMPVAAVAGLGGSLGGLGAAGASNSNSNSNGNGVATEDFPLEDLLADGLDDWTLIGELDMAMVEDFKVNRALFRCNVQGCNQEFTDLSDRDFHISSHYTLCPFCLAFLPISEVPGEPHRCLEA